MSLIHPPHLQIGDKVAIVATARKITREELLPAIAIMKKWGLEVLSGKHLLNENNQFAGTDRERAIDLQTMLDDSSVKAIFIARGGYGTVRIIDMLDFTLFKKKPKWIVGYSDATVLHSHIHNLGLQTIHATMPIHFSKSEEATESLRKLLFGEGVSCVIHTTDLNRMGNTHGQLVGGNLSILYSLLGSVSDLDTAGKILFIEDLDEYLYHIDRMMVALKRAGKLSHIAGLVVGGMTDMRDNAVPFGKTAEEIIAEAVKEYAYPVCFYFSAGHINRNIALPLGEDFRLEVSAERVILSEANK